MAIHKEYKKKQINSNDLRIPVTFYQYESSDGPEPSSDQKTVLYECRALAYKPGMKDLNILGSIKEGLTIKIRDPLTNYIPNVKHKVHIDDYRYSDGKIWEIIDVAYDLEDNRFVKIVLGVIS